MTSYSYLQNFFSRKKIMLVSIFLGIQILKLTSGYGQVLTVEQDSIINKINELVRTCNHNINKGAWDIDKSIIDGYSSWFNYDSTNLDLFWAVYYTYTGKIKKLTTVYFFKYHVIYVTEDRVPAKNQTSNKLAKYGRQYYYWNNQLLSFVNTTKEPFDWQIDIDMGKLLITKFKRHIELKKDHLVQ